MNYVSTVTFPLPDSDMVDVFQQLSGLQLAVPDPQLQIFPADIHPTLQGHYLKVVLLAFSPVAWKMST